jgi:acyl-CoA thioesterase
VPELDDDTALERRGDRWVGRINDRWSIGPGRPNGGYIATFLIRALTEAAPQPDPLTMTVHYLSRPKVDAEAEVIVETLREARSHAFLQARLVQDGAPVAVALAAFGSRDREGPEMSLPLPDVPGPDELETVRGDLPGMTFRDRFEWRPPPTFHPARWGEGSEAASGGWQRLADGRELDDLAVPLFMDAFAPAVFSRIPLVGGVPTVELTVHWRGRPAGQWQYAEFRSRNLIGGYLEEDGLLWGPDGRLVAQSRQLALLVGPPSGPPA